MADEEFGTADPKSALIAGLKTRKRKTVDYPLAGFLGLADRPIDKVKVRVATRWETDAAVIAAHRYVSTHTKGIPEAASDGDVLYDNKTLELLHVAFRDFANPNSYSAFPSPGWMREHLTTHEIAVLLNLYNDTVNKTQPVETSLDDDRLEAIVSLCVALANTDTPNLGLATLSREQLAETVVRLAMKLDAERAALAPGSAAEPVVDVAADDAVSTADEQS